MILRNLLRRRMRTLLTILGITVGIAAIVTLVALSKGIANNFVQLSTRSEADLVIEAVQGQGQAMTLGTPFDEALIDRVRQFPEVKNASGMLYTLVRLPDVPLFIVFGYDPEGAGLRHFQVTQGTTLAGQRSASTRGGRPLLLGTVAADKLNKTVGDSVELEGMTFRVVGIFETGTAMEDSAAVISLSDAQTLANMPRQIMFLGIQLYHPDQVDAFKPRLERILPHNVEIAGTQKASMMLDMIEMLDWFAWGVAAIAALVGGIGMMNTMLMSVFERTREIGVLRAVGWRPRQVLGMILGEALILSMVGGVAGLLLGAGLAKLAAQMPMLAGMTTGSVTPQLMFQALSTAILLGIVGGLYPAWRAARLPPVEALSYDGGQTGSRMRRLPVGGMTLKSLARQRTRTVLTLLGLGVGVFGVLLMGSLTEGTVRSFNSMSAEAEITAVEANQADTSLSVIDERVAKRIAAMEEVRYTSGVIISMASTAQNPFVLITARDDSDPALSPNMLREGRMYRTARECVLGWKTASEEDLGLGDRLHLLGSTFTVVGIVQTGRSMEDNGVFIELREAQRLLNKPRQVMMLQIKLQDPKNTDALLASLRQEYPKLLFSRSAELTESLPDMESMQALTSAILLLTILVGSIALMNTMVMSVSERTREIGVLRAVGWGQRLVLRQMLAEALLLTLLSGLVGVVGLVIVVAAVQAMPSLGVMREMLVIAPIQIVQLLPLCLVLGLVGGLYPAWRATRLRPVEALRYE